MRGLAIVLAIAACGGDRAPRWRAAGATTPRDGGTLRLAAAGAITTLDPAIEYDEISNYVVHAIVEGLVGYDRDAHLVPRMAARWEISPDGRTYRFVLRDDLRYADGTAIVAADFERALERVLSLPDSPYGSHLANVVGAQDVLDGKATDCTGIVARDPRTLEIQLTEPNAALVAELAMPWAAPITEAQRALPGDRARREPLATGPYEVVDWDEGRRIELRRRAHYHDPAHQHLDGIVVLENVSRELQFMMFERGELDAAEPLTASDQRWLEAQPAWTPFLHKRAMLNAYGSRMNTRVRPFDDRRVRQALNYAVDKDRIVKLLIDTAVPAHGVMPPGTFGRDDDLAPYPHDPAKARALLREAGYPDGFETTYVTLVDEEAEKLAVSMQHDLAEVGVRIDIQTVTFTALVEGIGKASGPPFSIVPWAGDFPDPTSLLDPLFHSRNISEDNTTNFSFYANPELDGLLDAARGERDADNRAAMYRRAERIVHDDAPWIFGYHQLAVEVAQPYVRDYEPHPVWIRDVTTAWLDLGPDGERVPR